MTLWFVSSLAMAGSPFIAFTVVDEVGQPIPGAYVMESQEGEKHLVRSDTGRWQGSAFYTPNGREIPVRVGQSHTFMVASPRHGITELAVTPEKKKTRVVVTLSERALVPSEDATPLEVSALEAYESWAELYMKWITMPDSETVLEVRKAGEFAASQVREWLDASDDPRALDACLQVGTRKFCGA